jgi:hypothetical protein
MTKTLLDRTVVSAIHGEDITNQFKAKCKTAKDWKKLEQRCYRKGWMYKLFVDGHLWTKSGDPFVLFAEYSDQEAVKFAFNYSGFSRCCFTIEDVPEYTFPFQLFNRERLVYRYTPKTLKPNWEIYELYVPDDPIRLFYYAFYSKSLQDALSEAHHKMRYSVLNSDGILATPEEYMPKPYQVLCNGKIIYDYVPPVDICINPDYIDRWWSPQWWDAL